MEPDPGTLPLIDTNREYTAKEAARIFGVDVAQIYRWADPSTSAVSWSPIKGQLRYTTRKPFRTTGAHLIAFRELRQSLLQPHCGVIVKAESGNAKLGHAAATYVARQSCPETCPFQRNGCYAEHDNTRAHWDRITAGSIGKSPLELARTEAELIDTLPGERDLRLHVAGDSITEEGTRLIATACERYIARGEAAGFRVRVWAYTHAFRTVTREAWGCVSVLASCETPADVQLAHERGYAAAIVVPEFTDEKAHDHGGSVLDGGVRLVPCLQQTRERSCTECRLCFDDRRLHHARLTIGFALHGWGINKARVALVAAKKRVSLPVVEVTAKAA